MSLFPQWLYKISCFNLSSYIASKTTFTSYSNCSVWNAHHSTENKDYLLCNDEHGDQEECDVDAAHELRVFDQPEGPQDGRIFAAAGTQSDIQEETSSSSLNWN